MPALFGKKKKEEKKTEPEQVAEVENEKKAVSDEPKPEVKIPKGGDEHAYRAIIAPHMTEKASVAAEENKYVFKVANDSSKIEIKKAIEKMYKVKVRKVSITMRPSKTRRIGRNEGIKVGFKKAIVTLVKGDKIEIVS